VLASHCHRGPSDEYDEIGELRDTMNLLIPFLLTILPKVILKGGRIVKVILERFLVPTRHKDDILDTCFDELLDDELDDWLVDDREHLLGHRFGRRQESGTTPGDGDDSFLNFLDWRLGHSRVLTS
jgi:hypothetical protein